MSEIESHHVFENTQINNPGFTWQTVATIAAAGLKPNGKYVIFAEGKTSGTFGGAAGNKKEVRVIAEGAELTGSFSSRGKPQSMGYFFLDVITVGASPTDITMELQSVSQITGWGRGFGLFAMLLSDDLVEGVDYAFGKDTTQNTPGTSYEDKQSLTFQASQTANWGVWGYIGYEYDASPVTTEEIIWRMQLDGATAGANIEPNGELGTLPITERQNDNELLGMFRAYPSLSSAEHTVKMQVKSSAGTNDTDFVSSAFFALNLDKFKDVVVEYVSAGLANTTANTEFVNQSVTPSVNNSNFLLAFGMIEDNLNPNQELPVVINFQINDANLESDPGTGADGAITHETARGFMAISDFAYVNFPDSLTDVDVNTSCGFFNSTGKMRSFALFSMELVDVRKVQGTVLENGNPVARTVVAYRSASPFEKVGETTSDAGDGSFTILNLPNTPVDVMVRDDDAGDAFNALIFSKVVPVVQ